MYDVTIQLVCTRKPGTLSRIIREIKVLGLQYRDHKIEFGDRETQITIGAGGELNCSRDMFEQLFAGLPEVLSVRELSIMQNGKHVDLLKTTVSKSRISAQEALSPAILVAAEKRFSDIMGPVSSFIVEAAAIDCKNAGELFVRLADELNDDGEREQFLSIIDGVD